MVANKGTAQTGLTLAELIKLCKGQTTKWPDGRLSTVVLRDPTAPEMKLVVEKIFASTPSAAKELIDTVNREHRSRPVIVLVKSDADVMQRVQSTPGAIGLADVYSITSGVEVIRVGESCRSRADTCCTEIEKTGLWALGSGLRLRARLWILDLRRRGA